MCRDEVSGSRLLDPATVPLDVEAESIALVGAYGIKIRWSDGHDTGIYTYDYLLALCPCERCEVRRDQERRAETGGDENG
jgi:ATP-binding protein involved in chromosome partitioning